MALVNAIAHIGFGASHRGRDGFQQENRSRAETFDDLVRKYAYSGDAVTPPAPLQVDEYMRVSEAQLGILEQSGDYGSSDTPSPHYDQVHDAHAPQVVNLIV